MEEGGGRERMREAQITHSDLQLQSNSKTRSRTTLRLISVGSWVILESDDRDRGVSTLGAEDRAKAARHSYSSYQQYVVSSSTETS